MFMAGCIFGTARFKMFFRRKAIGCHLAGSETERPTIETLTFSLANTRSRGSHSKNDWQVSAASLVKL